MIALSTNVARFLKTLVILAFLIAAHAEATGQELESPFVSPRLITAEIGTNAADALASRFGALMGRELPNAPVPTRRYSDGELKLLLARFDQIAQMAVARIEERLAPRGPDLLASIGKESWPKGSSLDHRVIGWAIMNSDFMIETQGLSSLARVLWVLAPDKISFPARWRPDEDAKIFGLYAVRRFMIHSMLNSPEIAPLLPVRFDVPRLKSREAEITGVGLPLARNVLLRYPDGQIVRTTMAAQDLGMPELKDLVEEVGSLAGKAQCIAKTSNRC
jgi:hypothetical protein